MKKAFLILLSCFICFSLTACNDPGPRYPYHYPYEELTDNVIGVELINYDGNGNNSFNFEKIKNVEVLASEKLDDFWQDLSEMTIWNRPNFESNAGVSIRIVYSNGEFDLMSCNNTEHKVRSFLVKYNSEGKMIERIGSVENKSEFVNIITNYFTTIIDNN